MNQRDRYQNEQSDTMSSCQKRKPRCARDRNGTVAMSRTGMWPFEMPKDLEKMLFTRKTRITFFGTGSSSVKATFFLKYAVQRKTRGFIVT